MRGVLKLSCNLNGSFNKHVLVNYIDKNLSFSLSISLRGIQIVSNKFYPEMENVNMFCQFRIPQIANKRKLHISHIMVYSDCCLSNQFNCRFLYPSLLRSLLVYRILTAVFACCHCHFLYLQIWKRAIILSVFLICWLTNKYKLIAPKKRFDKIYSLHGIILDGLFYLRFFLACVCVLCCAVRGGRVRSVWSLHKTMTCAYER